MIDYGPQGESCGEYVGIYGRDEDDRDVENDTEESKGDRALLR